MTAKAEKKMLCYKCNENVKTHPKCNKCTILRHPKDPKCSCKLSAREFAYCMKKNAEKDIITLN